MTRLTTDVTVVQNALVSGTRPLVRGPVCMVAGLLYATLMSPSLAVVFFVVVPALAVAMFLVVRAVAPLYQVLQRAMDRLNDALQEDLTAIRVIKAYVREGVVAERFAAVNAHLAATATRTFRTAVLNMPILQGAMYATCVAILWLGGQMILAGTLTVGAFTGFLSYVLQIVNSLMMISNVFLMLARAVTSVERVREVLSERPEITSPERALALENVHAVAQRAGHLTAQVVGGKNFLQGLFSKTGHCYTSQCFGRKACPAAPFQIIFILVEERCGGNTAFRTLFARSFTKAGTHGANYRRGVPRLCLRYSMGLMPISLRKLWEK